MKKGICVILALLMLNSCTGDEEQIQRVLKAEGCTEVNLTGYDAFGCDSDYSSGFTAVRNSQHVKGVVCSGVLRGVSVRYY